MKGMRCLRRSTLGSNLIPSDEADCLLFKSASAVAAGLDFLSRQEILLERYSRLQRSQARCQQDRLLFRKVVAGHACL
jgi:hypothetical protein